MKRALFFLVATAFVAGMVMGARAQTGSSAGSGNAPAASASPATSGTEISGSIKTATDANAGQVKVGEKAKVAAPRAEAPATGVGAKAGAPGASSETSSASK